MIPSIFEAKSQELDGLDRAEQAAWSRSMSGALIGFAGAIGALGGVGINLVLRASYPGTAKSATMAFWVFLAFYVVCVARHLVRCSCAARSADAADVDRVAGLDRHERSSAIVGPAADRRTLEEFTLRKERRA